MAHQQQASEGVFTTASGWLAGLRDPLNSPPFPFPPLCALPQVGELNKQAFVLDSRFRRLTTERQQFRVDAEVADSMNEMMTR